MQNSKEDKIIITHGTDTMAKTANILGETIKENTIVLTYMLAAYTFDSSDGLFNLGSNLTFLQTSPKTVYIVMNGKYFNYNNIRKNAITDEFEEINI